MKTRIQKEKAKHRTGMIKNRTGPGSENQYRKRAEASSEFAKTMKRIGRKAGLNI